MRQQHVQSSFGRVMRPAAFIIGRCCLQVLPRDERRLPTLSTADHAAASLVPTVRRNTLSGPPPDRSQVREIGLLISHRCEGAFTLSLDWIAVE